MYQQGYGQQGAMGPPMQGVPGYTAGPPASSRQDSSRLCADAFCGTKANGASVMAYVGPGGSYQAETTYKYVGEGSGEFAVQPIATSRRMPLAVLLVAILAVSLLLLLACLLGRATPSTTMKFAGLPGDCNVWGDPHVQTFDKTFVNQYREGEFWLVNSGSVKIQGRFLETPFTDGLSALHQISIGGPFLGDSTVTVGPMENGELACGDAQICAGFPSNCSCGASQITVDSDGQVVDQAQSAVDKHIVHIALPGRITIEVFRWSHHVNARIRMSALANGQEGICGNFNNQAADDTQELVAKRSGHRVPVAELLFNRRAPTDPNRATKTIADCPYTKRKHAEGVCATRGDVGQLREFCIFDVCFGGDRYAGQEMVV